MAVHDMSLPTDDVDASFVMLTSDANFNAKFHRCNCKIPNSKFQYQCQCQCKCKFQLLNKQTKNPTYHVHVTQVVTSPSKQFSSRVHKFTFPFFFFAFLFFLPGVFTSHKTMQQSIPLQIAEQLVQIRCHCGRVQKMDRVLMRRCGADEGGVKAGGRCRFNMCGFRRRCGCRSAGFMVQGGGGVGDVTCCYDVGADVPMGSRL